ncbi:MAG: ABC transporter permease [Verrucomicrobiales bacterium]|nr:ABC transporter permease [Verrucomicrobiales bacterium]
MMMIRHTLHEAWSTLTHYRLRAALTMLSVTWGVASLMLLLSYGNGFGTALIKAFDQIGKDLIVVFGGQTSEQAGGERSGRRIQLEYRDVVALRDGVPAIDRISPELRRHLPVSFGYRTKDHSVAGVEAAFETIRQMDVEFGRFLSDDDVAQRRRVAILGAGLKKELFSGLPALGTDIKIGGVRYTVIGVLRKKTQISNYSTPDDESVFVPYSTLSAQVDARYLDDIVILPAQNGLRDRVVGEVRAALGREHRFSPRDERAVMIMDWNQFRGLVTNLSLGLNLLLTIIGTLTLSVGAVGVMNIMLVSVTERTREIGVLKAIGARRTHILGQILVEGLALTLAGGMFGVLLALILTKAIGSLPLLGPLFEDTSGQGDIHLGVSVFALLVALVVLTLVGLAAALVPALRAARLDPVRAIRNE